MTKVKGSCSVNGCESTAKTKGFCGKHYQRYFNNGDPLISKVCRDLTPEQQVVKRISIVDLGYETECWKWLGSTDKDNYGKISIKGVWVKAHRLAYKVAYGKFDETLQVLHKCDNPICINPNHLFLGSTQENTLDRCLKDRSARGIKIDNSKLQESDIQVIRNSNKTVAELSEEFNVYNTTIYNILNNKTWRHIK